METIGSLLDIQSNMPQYEFLVEKILVPTFDILKMEMVCELVGFDSPWYKEIFYYLHNNIILTNLSTNEYRIFIHKSTRFSIIDDTLYRWSLGNTLIWCIDTEE